METIIGLLFVLLPVLFKFIEKKLQESGKNVQIEDILMDMDPTQLEGEEEKDEYEEGERTIAKEPVFVLPKTQIEQPKLKPSVQKVTVKPSAKKSVQKSSLLKKEEQVNKKKEKIDPKKLVIYSEIMKPKYQD